MQGHKAGGWKMLYDDLLRDLLKGGFCLSRGSKITCSYSYINKYKGKFSIFMVLNGFLLPF